MPETQELRPLERRVLRWAESGAADAEIGERFKRSERWAARVRRLAKLERPGGQMERNDPLRPLERRVLRWREQGLDHDEVGDRFRRSASHIEQVETLAHYKLSQVSS